MAQRDLMKTADRVTGTVNEYYEMEGYHFHQLKEMAQQDIYTALQTAFQFGYVMGGRAAKKGKYRERSRAADLQQPQE